MIVYKTHKQAEPNIAVASQPSVRTAAMLPDTLPSRRPGHDKKDWLRAEQEILRRAAQVPVQSGNRRSGTYPMTVKK